jgi:hypothetical protein
VLTCAHFCVNIGDMAVAKKRRKAINVILSPDDYRRFSTYCAQRGYKKSPLVARLIRDYLDSEKFAMQTELQLRPREL